MVGQVECQVQNAVIEEGIDGLNGEATNMFKLKSMRDQSFIYLQTDALPSCLKKTILKFTLKQLRHVSVLRLHHQRNGLDMFRRYIYTIVGERINLCLLKLQLFKYKLMRSLMMV